ncbi:MAG TPA: SurA N-terminal domain-containing protein, partial [Nitrospiraceae bacterium]|nr:SurA N-terminal domain-containing protein [Nitrospiraceae bacterium]
MRGTKSFGIVLGAVAAWLWGTLGQSSVCWAELPADGLEIVATVDGDPVYAAEVDRELVRVIGTQQFDATARDLLRSKTLEQLIDRRLIVHSLAANQQGVSAADVDQSISRLVARLKQREITWEQHLEQLRMTEAELRRLLEWQLGWQRYLTRY